MESVQNIVKGVGLLTIVSVIMPTYNRADYLKCALDSVLAQTFTDFELLVLDECSTDHTQALVESYGDPRIKYYRHQVRLGMAPNWNFGVEHSEGSYVAFLHDDDEWEPEFLEETVQALENEPTASVAFTDHWLTDKSGNLLVEETNLNTRSWGREKLRAGMHKPFYEMAVATRPIHIVSMTFRKSVLPSLRDGLEAGSIIDYWMVVQLALNGHGAYYIPRRLSRYRTHEGSETSTGRLRTCPGYIWVLRQLLNEPALAPYRPHMYKKLAGSYVSFGSALIDAKRYKEARSAFARAYAIERSNKIALSGLLLTYLPSYVFQAIRRLKRSRQGVS